MRWATLLMPVASATDEPPYFCTTMPTAICPRGRGGPVALGWEARVRTARPARHCASGSPSLTTEVGLAGQHLIGRRDLVGVELDLGVEPVVGDDRQEGVEHGACEV